MKIKLLDTVICRTPVFGPGDALEEKWQELKTIIHDSSPTFYEIISQTEAADLNGVNEKTAFSIWKYFNRARYRATPFGGFAAFTVLPVSTSSPPPFILDQEIKTHNFIDWKEKELLTSDITKLASSSLYFQTNTSLYFVGAEIRYLRFRNGCFEIASVGGFPELIAILNLCREKTSAGQVYQFMTNNFRIPKKRTLALLNQLLELQLLITERFPNITGEDYFERLGISNIETWGYTISERKPVSGGLDGRKLKDLPSLMDFLSTHLPTTENNTFNNFKNAFSKKFDQQLVPLAIAIDPETGVGYADLGQHQTDQDLEPFMGIKRGDEKNFQINYSTLHRFLLNGIIKGEPIQLDKFDLGNKVPSLPLPNTFSVLLRFWKGQPVIESAGGCTANALLGRFTIASNYLEAFGRHISDIEEKANPGVIFFDIAYQAEKQVDNVNRRKQLYKHELPVLTWSCNPSPLQLADLLVAVRNNEVILWSKKHNKRMVPRIPSAYNYTRSDLAVYRFLCDLQHQQIKSDLNFKIRHFFPGLSRYPRVVYKDIILSPAMWMVPQEFIQADKTFQKKDKKTRLLRWLQDEGIVFLFKSGNSDQTLSFDPSVDNDMDQFLLFCRQNTTKEMYISEALTGKPDGLKDKNDKNYAAEYIVSYSHENPIYTTRENLNIERVNGMIPPGGDWLYFEIYCHPSRSNDLLLNRVAFFMKEINKKLRKWFFIRYDDPQPHIRLRLLLKETANAYQYIGKLKAILEPDCIDGLISDIQLKTYFRETERYGVDRIEIIEDFFCADSKYIFHLLRGRKTTDELYTATLLMMLRLLKLCLNNINDQLLFVKHMAGNFSTEFGMDKENFKKLNLVYRQLTDELISNNSSTIPAFSARYERLFIDILSRCHNNEVRSKMTADLIHMHINRLFFTDQRVHEAILYQHLLKILKSRYALSAGRVELQAEH